MTFEEIKNKLKYTTIGIAGAGGLGSNAAVALARCGVESFVIADFDIIEETNLNRQYYFRSQIGQKKVLALSENLLAINSRIKISTFDKKLGTENIPQVFANCPIIIEAFDSASMKKTIIETVASKLCNTVLIVASGIAGWADTNALKWRKVDNNLYICGDELSEVSSSCPPLATRVAIVANMQANIVLEILLGKG